VYYPEGDSVNAQSDVLTATTDGKHILGAALVGGAGPITVSDIGVTIPTTICPGAPGTTLSPMSTGGTLNASVNFSQVDATAVDQIVASPASNLAFITYQGTSTGSTALLPYYVPGSNAAAYVPLAGGSAIAPVTGAFAPDDSQFFVGTTGDNLVHFISIPKVATNPAAADVQQIAPSLPACVPVSAGGNDVGCTLPSTYTGTVVPTTAIAVKPRSTT
jgi:hypothetical protein